MPAKAAGVPGGRCLFVWVLVLFFRRRQGSFIPIPFRGLIARSYAQHGPLTFVRIGCSTHADTPKEHKLGLEYNVATIGFVHGIDAAGARIALHNEDLLRSGCIKVDFCAGHEHDVTMDDELDEGDFDGSDDMGSGDEMDF